MLKQRVITALVLLVFLLPALVADAIWPFALLTILMISAAGWEWGRLNGLTGLFPLVLGAVLAAGCAGSWLAGWSTHVPALAWSVATACWVLGGGHALRAGPAQWPQHHQGARLIVGAAILWAAWLALASAKALSLNFILSAFCLVWVADIAAYFGGRTWGHRKLAPTISPGKSWEGVWTGMAGVLLLAVGWMALEQSLFAQPSYSVFSRMWNQLGPVGWVVSLAFLTGLSVMGDLMESLVKRAVGVKDSSGLLPGHGGVLDRIDALLPVLPAVLALSSL